MDVFSVPRVPLYLVSSLTTTVRWQWRLRIRSAAPRARGLTRFKSRPSSANRRGRTSEGRDPWTTREIRAGPERSRRRASSGAWRCCPSRRPPRGGHPIDSSCAWAPPSRRALRPRPRLLRSSTPLARTAPTRACEATRCGAPSRRAASWIAASSTRRKRPSRGATRRAASRTRSSDERLLGRRRRTTPGSPAWTSRRAWSSTRRTAATTTTPTRSSRRRSTGRGVGGRSERSGPRRADGRAELGVRGAGGA